MTRRKAMCLALVLVGCSGETNNEPAMSREELMKPETCKECHPKHYEEWSGSMHAYAAEDPIFLAMNKRGQEETGGKLGDFCVKCHAPLAVSEGALTDAAKVDELPQYLKGVTCYFCHNVESVEGTHNNPLVLANDQTMRGGIADPVKNKAHHSEYSLLHDADSHVSSSTMCGACHDLVVPKAITGAAEDVHLERTFAEYQQTLFKNDGASGLGCGSSCHMVQSAVAEPIADYKGVRSRRGHSHTFPGVDTALTDFPGRDVQHEQVQNLLSFRSVRATLCVNQEGGILVRIDNTGAGHNFPSGASQDRRIWVEVISYDDAGSVIYSSGVVADDQPLSTVTDPDLWVLGDKALRADGTPAHMFWDVASVEMTASNGREPTTIPGARTRDPAAPGFGVEIVDHGYNGSNFSGMPARVTLRLRVRAMDLDVIDDLIASGHLAENYRQAIPTFDINPNPTASDFLLEWTPVAFDKGVQYSTLGETGYCVENGISYQ